MKKSETMEIALERTIPAAPSEVYKAWLNKKVPGTTWYEHDKLILNAKLGGFFYWLTSETPHYGRFTKLEPGKRIQYTWMSRYTSGEESIVTVTFKKKGDETRMNLVHSNLPKNEKSKEHIAGWNYFLDKFTTHIGSKKGKKK